MGTFHVKEALAELNGSTFVEQIVKNGPNVGRFKGGRGPKQKLRSPMTHLKPTFGITIQLIGAPSVPIFYMVALYVFRRPFGWVCPLNTIHGSFGRPYYGR